MGLSSQEYWGGLPFPSPGDLSNPGIEPGSPALQADALPFEPSGKPYSNISQHKIIRKSRAFSNTILKVTFQLQSLQSIGYTPHVLKYMLEHVSHPFFVPPTPLPQAAPAPSPLVTTSLFSVSASLLLFCYIH